MNVSDCGFLEAERLEEVQAVQKIMMDMVEDLIVNKPDAYAGLISIMQEENEEIVEIMGEQNNIAAFIILSAQFGFMRASTDLAKAKAAEGN
jgi:hypothetical protein